MTHVWTNALPQSPWSAENDVRTIVESFPESLENGAFWCLQQFGFIPCAISKASPFFLLERRLTWISNKSWKEASSVLSHTRAMPGWMSVEFAALRLRYQGGKSKNYVALVDWEGRLVKILYYPVSLVSVWFFVLCFWVWPAIAFSFSLLWTVIAGNWLRITFNGLPVQNTNIHRRYHSRKRGRKIQVLTIGKRWQLIGPRNITDFVWLLVSAVAWNLCWTELKFLTVVKMASSQVWHFERSSFLLVQT